MIILSRSGSSSNNNNVCSVQSFSAIVHGQMGCWLSLVYIELRGVNKILTEEQLLLLSSKFASEAI